LKREVGSCEEKQQLKQQLSKRKRRP
jgi:hypothetical protein